jgi:hypothetical protein
MYPMLIDSFSAKQIGESWPTGPGRGFVDGQTNSSGEVVLWRQSRVPLAPGHNDSCCFRDDGCGPLYP